MMAAAALAAPAPAPATGAAAPVNVLDSPAGPPMFVGRPSPADYSAAYPRAAAAVGMGGRALLHCHVIRDGGLSQCQITREFPSGAGFGGAALKLSRSFRVDAESEAARRGEVDLPIGFATQVSEDEQLITGPWLAAPGFADTAAVYPDIGGGVSGQVFLHCALARDGSVKACKARYMRPADREFDAAALKLSHLFRMRVDPKAFGSGQAAGANVLLSIAAPYGDDVKVKRIVDPVWLAVPDGRSLAQLFPAAAAKKGIHSGMGTADCTVAGDGALQACQASGDGDPPGLGFSDAAAKAAAVMRMSPWTDAGGPVDGAQVRIPLRFTQAAK
jgi:TonB family protein